MFDSLALLQSEVERALGHLDRKLIDPEDITAAAMETLAFYGLRAAQSQYGRTSKHVTFTPTSRDAPVNKAAGMIVPSYVERKIGHAPNESWVWIPATHPSLLSDTGGQRVAWYRDANGLRLQFNYDPVGEYRVWYYTDPVIAQALEDPLGLPTRFGFLFLHKTILNVIPVVMQRAGQLSEEEQLNSGQLAGLSAAISHAQAQVKEWEPLWKTEQQADRAPRGRNRRRLFEGMQF